MLEGLKVIEMSTYVAAPGAGGMLRDWGAVSYTHLRAHET